MTDTRAKNALIEKASSEIDQLWAIEAEDRFAAYHRGEIKALET